MGPLKLRFWGTRAMVSAPKKSNAKYGGNTTCLQILWNDKLIIIDSGFGITNLGDTLFGLPNLQVHIIYTQFRWDHTQGLPFFLPIYFPENTINLYSPHEASITQKNLDILFDSNYSPFEGLTKMPANIQCHKLSQGQHIEGLKVEFAKVNKGKLMDQVSAIETYAYKITEVSGSSVCVAFNHEAVDGSAGNNAIIELGQNCDILIHDALYSESEYQNKTGWGHSSGTLALSNAKAMKAKKTILSQHGPHRNDFEIDAELKLLQKIKEFSSLDFCYAREECDYHTAGVLPKKSLKAS